MNKRNVQEIQWKKYLLCLVLLTLLVTGITFSKYITSVTGDDQTQVSIFNPGVNDLNTTSVATSQLVPGGQVERTFIVTNQKDGEKVPTEVDLTYTIDVETTGNLPLKISICKLGTDDTQGEPLSTDDTKWGVRYKDSLAKKTLETQKYKVIILWPNDEEKASYKYFGEIDQVNIIVNFEQSNSGQTNGANNTEEEQA